MRSTNSGSSHEGRCQGSGTGLSRQFLCHDLLFLASAVCMVGLCQTKRYLSDEGFRFLKGTKGRLVREHPSSCVMTEEDKLTWLPWNPSRPRSTRPKGASLVVHLYRQACLEVWPFCLSAWGLGFRVYVGMWLRPRLQ